MRMSMKCESFIASSPPSYDGATVGRSYCRPIVRSTWRACGLPPLLMRQGCGRDHRSACSVWGVHTFSLPCRTCCRICCSCPTFQIHIHTRCSCQIFRSGHCIRLHIRHSCQTCSCQIFRNGRRILRCRRIRNLRRRACRPWSPSRTCRLCQIFRTCRSRSCRGGAWTSREARLWAWARWALVGWVPVEREWDWEYPPGAAARWGTACWVPAYLDPPWDWAWHG
mmetsp:Transcript_30743/g.74244  ORF Transcript_30743/g.74244 Transcript_30743/m.74244 type:complete len:224 (-) Transcript_30743:262-933(-)